MLSVVPTPVVVRAPSKVNLHLSVGDLRPDGYHELSTVFQALSLTDEVRLAPSRQLRSRCTATVRARCRPTRATWRGRPRAARRSAPAATRWSDDRHRQGHPGRRRHGRRQRRRRRRARGLNELWRLELGRDELDEIAPELGSDVPFALHGGTALGTGRGEQLLPVLSRNTFHWVIALAKGGLSTPDGVPRTRPAARPRPAAPARRSRGPDAGARLR